MDIGKLNKRIVLQYIDGSIFKDGVDVENWVDSVTIWAKAEPLRGKELWMAQSIHQEINMKFTIRYRKDVSEDMRILYDRKYFEIVSIVDIEEKHTYMEITCKVVV
jgi:SPP1 family predicted phage head-tail adaptor